MDLGEALVAILLFSIAGLVAAQWQGRRSRSESTSSSFLGATILGFVFGGILGAMSGFAIGQLVIVFSGPSSPQGEAGDEIAQFFIGPGLIIGAFAGAYIGRSIGQRRAIRRQHGEDW